MSISPQNTVNPATSCPARLQPCFLFLNRLLHQLLEGINGGSDLALEMVRRNLIDFVVLSRALYQSTEDTRKKDPGLQRLYQALNPVVELHGALSSAGIDVDERDWARTLVSQVPNLRRLR